jgi:glycosyltransferase involved in cell wall biosynthesis
MDQQLLISLAVSTINRTQELERLLDSIVLQNYPNLEIILVDQNKDDRLQSIIRHYEKKIKIVYLKGCIIGVSNGRNFGLKECRGEIICMPDDDCWYPHNLLKNVENWFQKNPEYDGLCGCTIDTFNNLTTARWDKNSGPINQFNVWKRGVTSSIFLRSSVVRSVGDFDPKLGPGADSIYQSGEETDYLLRAILKNQKIFYNSTLKVYHLDPIKPITKNSIERGRKYAPSMGFLLKKYNYPYWFLFYHLLRPFGGAILSLGRGNFIKMQFYFTVFLGRIKGWRSY